MAPLRLLRGCISLPLRAAQIGAYTTYALTTASTRAAAMSAGVVTAPVRQAAESVVPVIAESVKSVVKDLAGRERDRRCWQGGDRYWIEVHGLDGSPRGIDLGHRVRDAVRAQPGIISADLNYSLSRIVVRVGPDAPAMQRLRDVVASQESAGKPSGPRVDLPADNPALASSVVGATLNAAGLAVALAGQVLRLPRWPAGATAVVSLVDYQPRLRRLVEQSLGAYNAETTISLAATAVYTLTRAPASLAVDMMLHVIRAAEAGAAADAWRRHQPVLAAHASCPPLSCGERPRPCPAGPVERYSDRAGLAQSVGPTVLGLITGNLNTAATAAAVAAPRAARYCRESFASTLSRGLCGQYGVVPLKPAAFRLLDRVDAVVVDPRALCTAELRVGRIRGVPDRQRAAVWEWAASELDRGGLAPGWHQAGGAQASSKSGCGEVLIRNAHHLMAAAVVREIRRSGADAVSLDVGVLDDLRPVFDDLRPAGPSTDQALAAAVTALQAEGRTVAVVSSLAAQALCSADVSIGLIPENGAPPWPAQLLVHDLTGVWVLLHSLPAARKASRRGVEISAGASMLGALLMVPGVRGRGPGPVTAGAAAALVTGYRLAHSALCADPPYPAEIREWHAMPVERVRQLLASPAPAPQAQTLPPRNARAAGMDLIRRVGEPPRQVARDFAAALREELSDPLTPVLAIGAAASAVLGSPLDAVLVGSVLTGNAALAATQRVRSERLLRRLLRVQDPLARRVIGSECLSVSAALLQPGDVIEVRPGEVVPADARLAEAADLEVDESSLTGESLPVVKQVDATPAVPLAERACMVYAGTTVVAGTAVGIVTAVGPDTQARRAAEGPRAPAPGAVGLQSRLRDLTDQAWPVGMAGGALVGALAFLRMAGLRQAVSSAVAVSVAAVPEGLPLVATLAQQASARRLTGLGALVRSPRSLEALGRVDVVCFDKTGTLSRNRLRVVDVRPAPHGHRDEVCATAARATPPANGKRHEHATDVAVIDAAGIHAVGDAAYLPFRSGRPFSASVSGDELTIKGAPEVVLRACTDAGPEMGRAVEEMAGRGLRVIAVARRALSAEDAQQAREDDEIFARLCRDGLELTGLLGLADTPRPESADVLAALAEQQIAVRLITGDHPVTATAIAAELGMAVTDDQVITGADWEALSRRGQEKAVTEQVVFARMSPEHKVQIVETLQRIGRVCAMVGDGANDAAAIRAATVGIGVVASGSDPARVAADVMLLDGRIMALLDALDEGRQLWRRVQAAVSVLLGGNAGEVTFAIVGAAIAGRAPLNARQLLLVNLLTDALPAAALAVSPPTTRMRGAGRGPDEPALWRTVAIRGATTAAGATAAWVWASLTGRPRRASTVALVALVATQLGQTLLDSRSPLVVGTAIGSLIMLATAISTPGLSQLLGNTPLGPVGWTQAMTAAVVATLAAAVAPRLISHRDGRPADQSSISTTPARHSTAYNSRNGTASARATSSVNGSVPLDIPDTLTPADGRTPNSP